MNKISTHKYKSRIITNLAQFAIVVLIIISVVIFVIMGMMLLDINHSFNSFFQPLIEKTGINQVIKPYYSTGSPCTELELIGQLYNSAFNNNMLILLYSIITAVISGIGGYILNSSLTTKQQIQDIIDEYKIKQELLETQYKVQAKYDAVNIDLDSCSDVLLLIFVNNENGDTEIKYMVKLRDCSFSFKRKICDLNYEYNRKNPFNKEQVKVLELKADRIKYAIENSRLKTHLSECIEFLNTSIKILQAWYDETQLIN